MVVFVGSRFDAAGKGPVREGEGRVEPVWREAPVLGEAAPGSSAEETSVLSGRQALGTANGPARCLARQWNEPPMRSRAMISRWTSLGPSPIRRIRISRYQRSRGRSLVTP